VPIASTILVVALSLAGSQASASGRRWWLDEDVQARLALTDIQVVSLQSEYDRTLEHRKRLRQLLDAADAELTRALHRGDLSDAEAEDLINRVEDLRLRRNVARMRLLVAMYFLLTPPQRARLPGLVRVSPR
jgi:Spy/CpxP family protein refolding chaperone